LKKSACLGQLYLETDLFSASLELSPNQRRTVAYVFEERYKFEQYNNKLVGEISFLKEIMSLLQKEQSERRGKISAHTLGLVIDPYLTNAIKKLEEISVDG